MEQQEEGERDEDRYRYVDHLTVSCVCGEKAKVISPTVGKGRGEKPSLGKCPAAKDCGGFPLQREGAIAGAIDLLVRRSLSKYYAGWLVCEDPGCSGRTRCIPLQFQRAYPVCPVCNKASMYTEFSPTALYTQLQVGQGFFYSVDIDDSTQYLQHVLDLPKMRERAEEQNEFRNNLVQVCIFVSNLSLVKALASFLELTINCDPAGGCGEEVLGAEGAVGGEVLEEQRLCHRDALQALRGLAKRRLATHQEDQ